MKETNVQGGAVELEAKARRTMPAAWWFVTVTFLLLAAAFLGTTVLLFNEFRDTDWVTIAIAHSHIFIFFPTFGVLALLAFHLPSVVFTHLYWNHVRFGRTRFLVGAAVVLITSAFVTHFMLGPTVAPRGIWEINPATLKSDRGSNVDCKAPGGVTTCRREPVLETLQAVRKSSQVRTGLSRFARLCAPDPFTEPPDDAARLRWCFPAGRMLTAEPCCAVQKEFMSVVIRDFVHRDSRSVLADREYLLQAAKVFFVIVVLVIGVMMVMWRHVVGDKYPGFAARIERNVFVGGIAMLIWPIMDYAYLDVTNVLYGRWSDDLNFRLSLVVAPWVLLLLFYYLRRFARKIEVIGQIVGVAGGVGAILVRDELKDWAARAIGIGISPTMWIILAALWLAGLIVVLSPFGLKEIAERQVKEKARPHAPQP